MSEFTMLPNGGTGPELSQGFRFDSVTWVLLAVLAVFVAAAFSPAAGAGFVDLDDNLYVFDNPHVLGGLSPHSVAWAMTTRTGGFYMPMTWLSLQLDSTIGKLLAEDVDRLPGQLPDARVYHVTNICLHALAAWMLFLFLYRATENRWAGFAAALLWAVHPLRVESVAWVTERKDVIAGLFGFMAMYLYVICVKRKGKAAGIWFWAACGAFVLSMWGKAMFATMPVLLVLVDDWPLKRIAGKRDLWRAIVEKWPLWTVSLLGSVAAALSARRNGTLAISQAAKAANALLSYVRYIRHQADFGSLAAFHPYVGSPPLQVWGGAAILLLVTAGVVWQRKRWPWLFMAWGWYLVAFLPMIGFVQSFSQAYADRFSYLPSVGLLLIVVLAVFRPGGAVRVPVIASLALAVVLAGFTFRQAQYWHDSITLFERTRDLTPPSPLVHVALGAGYARVGRVADAEREYLAAVELDPKFVQGRVGLVFCYLRTGELALALREAELAWQTEPKMDTVCDAYGAALFANGRFEEAAAQFAAALRLAPGDEATARRLKIARENAGLQ